MAIVGYSRVSTEDQSLKAQSEQLNAAGVERIYEEKVSGVKTNRPELVAMLDYVRDGDTVVVTKLDRIGRSTRHLLEIVDALREKGVNFRVLNISLDTSTATGKLMLTMLSAVASFEREMMLERQKEGIALAKAEGKYKGRQPKAREKAPEVMALVANGEKKSDIARQLGIGVASVYRIIKAAQ
jgi:DNA invertase Pin-like site-specific DNA recombinase